MGLPPGADTARQQESARDACLPIGKYRYTRNVSLTQAVETDPAVRLRAAVLRLARRLRRTDAGAALGPSAADVLGSVARAGEIGMAMLATAEHLNPTMLSRIVGHLERDGLLGRSADPSDARSVVVRATDKGRRLHAAMQLERTEVLAGALDALAGDDRAALLAALPALEQLSQVLRRETR